MTAIKEDCNCGQLKQEKFSAELKIPVHGVDPSLPCYIDPPSTIGIGIESIVAYDCKTLPHFLVPDHVFTGINQVGFIISSEYEVIPSLEKIKIIRNCEIANCQSSLMYQFEIVYYIYLVVGIGFGFGSGFFAFGTVGAKTRSWKERKTFTTECICCDPE